MFLVLSTGVLGGVMAGLLTVSRSESTTLQSLLKKSTSLHILPLMKI